MMHGVQGSLIVNILAGVYLHQNETIDQLEEKYFENFEPT